MSENNFPAKTLAEHLTEYPPPWSGPDPPALPAAAAGRSLVVLDDDPTGTQTVSNLPLLTRWDKETLTAELRAGTPVFYVLTNSRSLIPAAAEALGFEIGANLAAAQQASGRTVSVISRGDSTLRGHFPVETDALAAGLGHRFDAVLLIPAFFEGGRYTLGGRHYVAAGDTLIPAADTEFARDTAFGYSSSDLRAWVEEKTGGRIAAGDVSLLSLSGLRGGGPAAVTAHLLSLASGAVCVIDAACYGDLEVFVRGLLAAESAGKSYLCRTAASFVRVRAGQPASPPLAPDSLGLPSGGGLIIAGSYVPRTTEQLNHLLTHGSVQAVEVEVSALLADPSAQIARCAAEVTAGLQAGHDTVLYTSRTLVTGGGAAQSLAVGRLVSDGLTAIVQAVGIRPRYFLAKGGITSSDIAVLALGVRRAWVRGQLLPGIPVWQLGPECRWPGLTYIVFPGNVGGPEALTEAAALLQDARSSQATTPSP